MSASRSITVVPPGRGFSASLVIAASMCRIRTASPSSLPRMCSTFGMSPTSGCAAGILEAHAAARQHRARALAAVAEQHRPSADRLVGQLVDVATGHARAARHGMLDARRDEEEVAEAQAGRLGAGTLQPGLAVGDEMEDGVVLRRQPQPPRRGQLAVAVEALDEPQIPQHFGQGVVRLGPGRLVAARLPQRRLAARRRTIGYAFATSYHGPSGFRGVELFSSRLTGSAARRGSQPGSDIWRRLQ